VHEGDTLWKKLLDQIDSRGWGWQVVGPDQGDDEHEPFPHYCYTVGLVSKGLPDLIVVGLDIRTSIAIGDELIVRALGLDTPGRAVPTPAGPLPFSLNQELLDVFKGTRAMLVDVPPAEAAKRSLFAHDYAAAIDKAPDLIQLVWPDRNGRLPFEDGADLRIIAAQPVLKYIAPADPNPTDSPVM
jgi:hypothetical protein